MIGVGNGTDALTIALRALGVGPGDEVICPSLTFYATAEAIVNAGATPVFCDVDANAASPAATCARTCGPRTKAIVPVHLFGNVAPMAELRDSRGARPAARGRGPGRRRQARRREAGALGDAATFSFFPSKNLACLGDGGAIVTNDDEVAASARTLRFHGSEDKRTHTEVGYNSRLDSIQAAVLRVLLPDLAVGPSAGGASPRPTRQRARRAVELPVETTGGEHLLPPLRGPLRRARPARGAALRPARSARAPTTDARSPPGADARVRAAELPCRDELAAAESLALPMGPELSDEQVAAVVEACGAAVPA